MQDVDRCMPENLYFRQSETQRMMLDILFIFCKLNQDVGYRQGMHELLAPVLWVVERDAIDLGQSSKAMGEDAIIRTVFDAEHIEHDSFAIFSQIMHSAKNFYEQTTHSATENPIVLRSRRIFNDILMRVDPELARHLESIEIVPQVFLMRWIRLLFGREFAFDEVLTVWDSIFAEDASLELVDYVCIAMLLRVRWELLQADYNTALTLLLRYPQPARQHPPQTFVRDAWYLREEPGVERGGFLILKYSGRPMIVPGRSTTPPALQRNITAFSGINAIRAATTSPGLSPSRLARQPRNIEAVLQSTAKSLYARSEQLGIGKAVRSAVDEVHKKALEIRDAQVPSPPARRPQQANRAVSSRVRALEDRNRHLATLLEGAVGELWECQKLVADTDRSAEEADAKPDLEKLSVAIAKVQFVQVYLADSSLPLPEFDTPVPDPAEPGAAATVDAARSEILNEKRLAATDAPPEKTHPRAVLNEAGPELADPSTFDDDFSQPTPSAEHDVPALVVHRARGDVPGNAIDPKHASTEAVVDTDASAKRMSRPSLGESSFSWMLGQQDSAGTSTDKSHPPSRAQVRGSQGFLFGGGTEEGVDTGRQAGKGRKGGGSTSSTSTTTTATEKADDTFDMSMLRHGKGVRR